MLMQHELIYNTCYENNYGGYKKRSRNKFKYNKFCTTKCLFK